YVDLADEVVVREIAVDHLLRQQSLMRLDQALRQSRCLEHLPAGRQVRQLRGHCLHDVVGMAQVPHRRPSGRWLLEALEGTGHPTGQLTQAGDDSWGQVTAVHDGLSGDEVQEQAVQIRAVVTELLEELTVQPRSATR